MPSVGEGGRAGGGVDTMRQRKMKERTRYAYRCIDSYVDRKKTRNVGNRLNGCDQL